MAFYEFMINDDLMADPVVHMLFCIDWRRENPSRVRERKTHMHRLTLALLLPLSAHKSIGR